MAQDLGITFGQIRFEVCRYAGFDVDNLSSAEQRDLAAVISRGLRQFYRPPRLPGERSSYQWSFLRPQTILHLRPGIDDYDMPVDFAGLDGCLYFVDEDSTIGQIDVVNEGRILQLRQAYWYTATVMYPQYAAITPIPSDKLNMQRYRMQIWPKPDQTYTLRFKYFARQDDAGHDTSVPLGGSEHAQTILYSCLAAAEQFFDDGREATYREAFVEQLMASMDFDRKSNSPQNLGYNGDPGVDQWELHGYPRAIGGLVSYDKFPLVPDPGDPGEGEPPTGGLETQDGDPLVNQDGEPIVPQ